MSEVKSSVGAIKGRLKLQGKRLNNLECGNTRHTKGNMQRKNCNDKNNSEIWHSFNIHVTEILKTGEREGRTEEIIVKLF